MSVSNFALADAVDVYFGTGGKDGKGIYHSKLDKEKGKLSGINLAAEVKSPGFLAFHPDRKVIYAVAVMEQEHSVVAYSISENGDLSFINSEMISDGGGTHICVHPSGKFLMTVQYSGGSVAVFPLEKDGRVMARSQLVKHKGGSGVVPTRQNKPHPHWVGFSPDGRFAMVPDLGLDQIVVYQVQPDQTLIKRVGAIDGVPGGGPRHMRFSVDGEYIFLLNELDLSVSTFAYDSEEGSAELVATTPTLSSAMKKKESFNSSSEILVHPNGKFVYAGNRGSDTVTAFQMDPENGRLDVTDIEPIRGSWPRNINLDSSGRWLLAAGQFSDTVAIFSIDAETGVLTFPRGNVFHIPDVTCVLLND
jgi:6-phosphogluconolactonase